MPMLKITSSCVGRVALHKLVLKKKVELADFDGGVLVNLFFLSVCITYFIALWFDTFFCFIMFITA